MTSEQTAKDQSDEGRFAFRLMRETDLLESASPDAAVVRTLAAGGLITVRADASPFLLVISKDEEFGYIADATPVEPLTWSAEIDVKAASERAGIPYPEEVSAREFLTLMGDVPIIGYAG